MLVTDSLEFKEPVQRAPRRVEVFGLQLRAERAMLFQFLLGKLLAHTLNDFGLLLVHLHASSVESFAWVARLLGQDELTLHGHASLL